MAGWLAAAQGLCHNWWTCPQPCRSRNWTLSVYLVMTTEFTVGQQAPKAKTDGQAKNKHTVRDSLFRDWTGF